MDDSDLLRRSRRRRDSVVAGDRLLLVSVLLLAYGSLVAIAGTRLHGAGIKKHFFETYLHVAANVLFIAVLSGVFEREREWIYLAGLAGLAGIAIAQGVRLKRFCVRRLRRRLRICRSQRALDAPDSQRIGHADLYRDIGDAGDRVAGDAGAAVRT